MTTDAKKWFARLFCAHKPVPYTKNTKCKFYINKYYWKFYPKKFRLCECGNATQKFETFIYNSFATVKESKIKLYTFLFSIAIQSTTVNASGKRQVKIFKNTKTKIKKVFIIWLIRIRFACLKNWPFVRLRVFVAQMSCRNKITTYLHMCPCSY